MRPAAQPAGLPRRLMALLYDWILLAAVLFVTTAILLIFRGGEAFAPRDPVYLLVLILTGSGFFGWFWRHGGQTLGMRAWHLHLVGTDNQPITWLQCGQRSLIALIGGSLGGLGYAWMLLDAAGRCWQDIASGTRIEFRPAPRTKKGA